MREQPVNLLVGGQVVYPRGKYLFSKKKHTQYVCAQQTDLLYFLQIILYCSTLLRKYQLLLATYIGLIQYGSLMFFLNDK